jgi:hypothetical protein
MTQNPYDRNNFPGKFKTNYIGFADGFYCLRLSMDAGEGLDALMWQMEVSEWLFNTLGGKWHMGNDFPYKDHPQINLSAWSKNDYFVLIEKFHEVVLFEDAFVVSGITPSQLV